MQKKQKKKIEIDNHCILKKAATGKKMQPFWLPVWLGLGWVWVWVGFGFPFGWVWVGFGFGLGLATAFAFGFPAPRARFVANSHGVLERSYTTCSPFSHQVVSALNKVLTSRQSF